MQITRKVAPGQRGAQSLLDQSGSKLVCARSRYDRQKQKRCKTVKLIIEEASWRSPVPPFQDDELVALRVELKEVHRRQRAKMAGGKRNPNLQLWEIRDDQVRKLGLKERIQQPELSDKGVGQ